ncbi:hypothetical protein B0H14DRAFT_2671155 [Mycena olivaceomarginata]|nr:hypothetical protein B0H14DRAFT_2671155 [Mycena olivaceomarginata]
MKCRGGTIVLFRCTSVPASRLPHHPQSPKRVPAKVVPLLWPSAWTAPAFPFPAHTHPPASGSLLRIPTPLEGRPRRGLGGRLTTVWQDVVWAGDGIGCTALQGLGCLLSSEPYIHDIRDQNERTHTRVSLLGIGAARGRCKGGEDYVAWDAMLEPAG